MARFFSGACRTWLIHNNWLTSIPNHVYAIALIIKRFYSPEEFEHLGRMAHKAGIDKVASGPKVRSSYMAHALQGQNLRKTFPA